MPKWYKIWNWDHNYFSSIVQYAFLLLFKWSIIIKCKYSLWGQCHLTCCDIFGGFIFQLGPVDGPPKMQNTFDKNTALMSSFAKAMEELAILRDNLMKKEVKWIEMAVPFKVTWRWWVESFFCGLEVFFSMFLHCHALLTDTLHCKSYRI